MKILIVGAGGYGGGYVKHLLDLNNLSVKIEGVVDPFIANVGMKDEINAANIPVYDTMEEFYAKHSADLAVISTPPFLHCQQSICALKNGSYVLCEKPVAPTFAEAKAMMDAEKEYGKWIAIGYQWSYAEPIRKLKADILAGKFGKPLSFKTFVSWPRLKSYYSRSTGWAGKVSKDGVTVYDSIASNACAHYIHNMFYLLGNTLDTSARAVSVEAECLRANNIETFDTCILRMVTDNGVKAYFNASHAADKGMDPDFVYEFENATVTHKPDNDSEVIVHFKNGETVNYGNPPQGILSKLEDCMEAVKTGTTPVCTVKTACAHTELITNLHDHIVVTNFPAEIVKDGEEIITVDGLFEKLWNCYQTASLLSENGVDYAKPFSFTIG